MEKLHVNRVFGDYVCTHLLGSTTDGAVYKAFHREDPDQAVALRTLQIREQKLDDVLPECNDHMQLVKAISASHIVPVLDFGIADIDYYIVMPYIGGRSLRHLYKRSDRTPNTMPSFGEILLLAQSLAQALSALHQAGIGHGILEPRNILVTSDKGFYLADIGISRLTKIILSMQATGTLWTGKYTAPELWDGGRITPESDQYSLACVLYLLVTGHAPYQAKTIYEMMALHKDAIVTPPHYIRKDAPISLMMFFLTATAKTPEERYRSFDELIEEFAAAIEGIEGEPTGFFDFDPD